MCVAPSSFTALSCNSKIILSNSGIQLFANMQFCSTTQSPVCVILHRILDFKKTCNNDCQINYLILFRFRSAAWRRDPDLARARRYSIDRHNQISLRSAKAFLITNLCAEVSSYFKRFPSLAILFWQKTNRMILIVKPTGGISAA
jgi:hypothetical protein